MRNYINTKLSACSSPASMKHTKTGNVIEFYMDYQGTKVIILKAILQSSNDMPRLYNLAKDMLSELTWLGIRN